MVHFDRLKPCTNGVIQVDNPQLAIQDHVLPLNTEAVNLPPSTGTNLELLDDDSDQTTEGSGSTSFGPPLVEGRYPTRSHHPPTCYGDLVSLYLDGMSSLKRRVM